MRLFVKPLAYQKFVNFDDPHFDMSEFLFEKLFGTDGKWVDVELDNDPVLVAKGSFYRLYEPGSYGGFYLHASRFLTVEEVANIFCNGLKLAI